MLSFVVQLIAVAIAAEGPDLNSARDASASDQQRMVHSQQRSYEPLTVLIPAGEFRMGTSKEQANEVVEIGGAQWRRFVAWESPQHTVYLRAYRIGKHPVTNAQYQVFVDDSGHRAPAHWKSDRFPASTYDHPVGNISWNDAIAYTTWLATKTNKPYRLPTEAEWEKAARGDDGRIYPWGNVWDPTRLNSKESGPGSLTSVGSFSPKGDSPYGVSDMAGGLWEWVDDWFDASAYRNRGNRVMNPRGPSTGNMKCLRGGAFNLNGKLLARCAVRDSSKIDDVAIDDGFRVAFSKE